MTMFRILGKRGRVTIPYEIRQRIGFSYNDVLSFTVSDGDRAVVVRREKVCDHCKEARPTDMDGDALFAFLNGLPADRQREALIYLSVKWAESQGGK